jgi:glycosyltransferase involved in cell wall biosynthesis
MAHCDVAIAPLADVPFNRYKSQVKYLEAGLLRLPFVASPTVYANYVIPGRTGLIADDQQEWQEALTALVGNPQLRRDMGEAAAEHVQQWSVSTSTTAQLQNMLADFGVKVA